MEKERRIPTVTKRLPSATSRLAALADKGDLDGEVLEIETPNRTILYPKK